MQILLRHRRDVHHGGERPGIAAVRGEPIDGSRYALERTRHLLGAAEEADPATGRPRAMMAGPFRPTDRWEAQPWA